MVRPPCSPHPVTLFFFRSHRRNIYIHSQHFLVGYSRAWSWRQGSQPRSLTTPSAKPETLVSEGERHQPDRVLGEMTEINCIDAECKMGKFLKKQGKSGLWWYDGNMPDCSASASQHYVPAKNNKSGVQDKAGLRPPCFQPVYDTRSIRRQVYRPREERCRQIFVRD